MIEDTLETLAEEKRHLEMTTGYTPAEYAAAWKALALRYAVIGARANEAGCIAKWKHYLGIAMPNESDSPTYAWQEYA